MTDKHWPAWRFGPNGEQGEYKHEAHVPEGWRSTPFPGVDYSGAKAPVVPPEALKDLNDKLAAATATIAAKDEQIQKLTDDLFVADKREAGFKAELATANDRADKAEADAASQVEALKAAHAEEIQGWREQVDALKAQVAKFDRDGDGKVGGAPKAAPKQ